MKRKTALVTGSTSGIGLGIARTLARAGANVVLNGFGDAREIENLRAGLAAEHGVEARHDGADLSKPAEIEAMMTRALREFGRSTSWSTTRASSTSRRSRSSRSTSGTRSSPSISSRRSTRSAWRCRR